MTMTRRDWLIGTCRLAALGGASTAGLTTGLAQATANYRPEPNRRPLTQEDLDRVVADHGRWLDDPKAGTYADLTGADLSGLSLDSVSLEEANLTGARLVGTTMNSVNLTRANLIGADLTKVTFVLCVLAGANFSTATLVDAKILSIIWDEHGSGRVANLDWASFRHANLTGARIVADCSDVNFDHAVLVGADFSSNEINSASFVGANFSGANLENCEFNICDFSEANLVGARLSAITLVQNNFTGANLKKASLVGANLVANNFDNAKFHGANLRCALSSDDTGLSELINDLNGPNHLRCQKAGARFFWFQEQYIFPWSGGPKPELAWKKWRIKDGRLDDHRHEIAIQCQLDLLPTSKPLTNCLSTLQWKPLYHD